MDKPEKGTSSKNPKEKTSFLGNNIIESRESPDDEDIGKDFLSSWKAVTVNEDAMDFSFSMDSSSKNKTFDFDKLDMDFGLDGDFDKLSSFKVDMSDFNLSTPTKKATGPKEILEDESSTVKPQGKRSQFNFSFDFNELDNFNFESSLAREEKVSCKNKGDQMKVSFDDTEQKSSKIQLSEDASALDDTIATKLLPASKGVATSNVETLLSGPGYPDAIKPDCAMYVSSGAPNSSSNFRSSPEEAINTTAEATNHQCHISEKAIAIDMYTQPAPFECPDQSLVGVDSNGNSLSNGQTRTTYQVTGVNVTSSRKKDVNEKNTGFSSCKETLPLKNSSPPNIIVCGSNTDGKNESDTEITTETMLDNESAIHELDIAGNSSGSLPCKDSHDSRDNKEKQDLATVLPADPYSEPIAGKLTITNKKDAGAHKLEFSKKEGSALEAKSLSLGSEQTNIIHKSSTNETGITFNYDDGQHGINSGGNPLPAARELTKGEETLLMGAKNLKHPCNIGEGFTSDGLLNFSKLDRNSCLNGVEVKNTRPISVMSTSENTVKVQNTTRLEPVRMSKIKSVEWNKLSLVRSPKKIFDQSNLNNSMTQGAGKVSDCTPQKGINFRQSQDNDVEVQDNAASEIANPHKATKNQLPQSFSLKRKAFELPNSDLACLKPLKRLSSPSESREPAKQIVDEKLSRAEKILKPLSKLSKAPDVSNLNEPLKRVDIKESMRKIGEEKVFRHEDQEESNVKRILFSVPASKIESPPEATVMDLELSLTIETDGNVEKAEAFAKELEDICNMLRKKHEEAKEILVRALVNNNNLLMLNHPIYEEKICKVQKFAAELMSKALNT